MNRLITFVTIIFILAGAYVYFFPWTTVRFKLTAEFDTPQGIKAGSGVVEVTYGLTLGDFISRFYLLTASVRGDAVAVDVSDNQTVYVLLSGSLPYGVLEALGDKFKDEGARRIAYIRQLNGSARLKSDDYPLIATLDEPRDKRTVKGRLPTREAYPGVRLSGVKVVRTGDIPDRLDRQHS
jgi:hypothetical protein